ncbi:MAG TPA: hypothetical protein ENN34_10750 [Deltaproteobacteria bacterium]|nr:hypothetical protein [Deltaproteobacteria bacterium]
MTHTFLLEEGTWSARGFLVDNDGVRNPVEGQVTTTHAEDQWMHEGYMRVLAFPPVELSSIYEIVPFHEGSDITQWKSVNPVLGELSGTFTLVDDSILSVYHSPDGTYVGTEYLRKVSPDVYQNRGVLTSSANRVSSWCVELIRTKSGS